MSNDSPDDSKRATDQPPHAKHATGQPTTPKQADDRSASQPDPASGKVIAPNSPVEVPNLPNAHPGQDQTPDKAPLRQFEREADAQAQSDAADDTGKPRKIDPSKSSWADSTQPAPDKKNARTSIL